MTSTFLELTIVAQPVLRLWHNSSRLFLGLLLAMATLPVSAQPDDQVQTPPRLGFIEGQASFWRPGAEDWAPAVTNTPLAAGDSLYTADRSNLELQIGSRAFVRAADKTQLTLVANEPDFLQLQITSGRATLDIRTLDAGHSIEVDTPNAVFTVERTGYYRIEVFDDATHFITRRGGRATLTPAKGESQSISTSEEVIVRGANASIIETYVAPELDTWDRWNYARTDHYAEAASSRYLPSDIYGAEDLDQYGNWRVTPDYGAVWVPDRIRTGWAPYCEGSWVWDSFYGWTWIDVAPWGWAPFHYGRWVFINGLWAWAPGPIIARPIYAPALVAFFGHRHGTSISIGIGPSVGWVALGWGEPLVPWWGRSGFRGRPWWGGWGGPHIVNNTVINQTTVVNINNITYQNSRHANAFIAVPQDHFGRRAVHEALQPAAGELLPIAGAPAVQPAPASLFARTGPAMRPPEKALTRAVVATRPAREIRQPWQSAGQNLRQPAAGPAPRIVIASPQRKETAGLPRPPFGEQGIAERPRPAAAPRLEEMRPAPPWPGNTPERVMQQRSESQANRPAAPEAANQGVRIPPAPATREQRTRPTETAAPQVKPENRQSIEERTAPPPPSAQQPTQERYFGGKMRMPVRPAPSESAPQEPRTQAAPAVERRDSGREQAPPNQRGNRGDREERQSDSGQRELPGKPANRLWPRHDSERTDRGR